jgi:catechol 2,3-dioxygenase-like lactoylglutathione lyase family enzyme
MIPSRITVATLGAYDMPAMRAFYRALGWRVTANASDDFASFHTDGCILALFPFGELAGDARVPMSDVGTAFRGVTLALNVMRAEDVDASIEEIRAAAAPLGGRIVKDPQTAPWGGRSAYFADPEGNLWEVVWAPGAFDDAGNFVWNV